jgi:hypothetical protein
MKKQDRAKDILDMIRRRTNLPPEQQGWISPPIITEPQAPEPLSENRWAEFSKDFIAERDGEPVYESGYTTKEFYDKLLEVSEPDYESQETKKTSRKLRDMLNSLNGKQEEEEKRVEYIDSLEPFEAVVRLEDWYE